MGMYRRNLLTARGGFLPQRYYTAFTNANILDLIKYGLTFNVERVRVIHGHSRAGAQLKKAFRHVGKA